MSQTPTRPGILDRLDPVRPYPGVGPILSGLEAGQDIAARQRPSVIGKDRRRTWRKVSDWIFDGIFPDDQTNFYGTGRSPSPEQLANRERFLKDQRGGFIDRREGDARRLAADMLIGLADEGNIPLHESESVDLAAEILVGQAEETIEQGGPPERVREAQEIVRDQALRQQVAKEEAERGLSEGAADEDVTRRMVELLADGRDADQAIDEMRAGGWDFGKVSKTHLDRLAAEIEILLDEGQLHKAKALATARMNLIRGGGPADANATPYDVALDEIIAGQMQGLTRGQAFSIAGTDAFTSTIRAIGRLAGASWATEKDRDLLNKMTAASFEEHPVTSIAGSFAGGFLDPVFFGLSMGAAKAPITAAQRGRYAQSLIARGLPAEVAEQMAKKATLETIATNRLTLHFLGRGYSARMAEGLAGMVWNATDAAVSNALVEGIDAAADRASPMEIAIRTAVGGGAGLVMGVALDRAFRGIAALSRAVGGTVPRETGAKLDAVADYVAGAPDDAREVAGQLRDYLTRARMARDQLGRKLTNQEAADLATAMGFDLDAIAGRRAVQQRAQETGRAPAAQTEGSQAGAADARKPQDAQGDSVQTGAGDNGETDVPDGGTLKDPMQAEGEDLGVLKPERPEPTPAERAAQEAAADDAVRRQAEAAERGEPEPALDPGELERRAERAGITKSTPEPTPEQRRQQEADADEWARREAEQAEGEDLGVLRPRRPEPTPAERRRQSAEADEWARREAERAEAEAGTAFPERVSLDDLAELEAPSADMPGATSEDLAASAKFQRDNLDSLEHRGDDWVKVRLPLDMVVERGRRVDLEAEGVAEYATMDPATRPPVAAGPLAGDPTGPIVVADGNRRVAAARARGEADVVAYVPEWVAARHGLATLGSAETKSPRGPDAADAPVARSGRFGMFTGPDGKRPVTGRPVEIVGWRGSGRADDAGVYAAGVEGPILGRGIYVAASRRQAETYGPDVAETRIRLENPYVIEEVEDLRRLGGGEPVPTEIATMVPYMAKVADRLRRDGHDGVIVQLDDAGDNTPAGASNKRLRRLFEHTQAVAFDREAAPPLAPGAQSGIAPGGRQAKGPRTNAKPPPPSRAPAVGRETQVIVPGWDPLPARYAIVESEDLIPSHDARAGFQPNAYGDLNERPYNDPTEGRNLREGVKRIAEFPQTAFLLTDTPSPLDGPPVVTSDLVVLGGNARAMAQQVMYRNAGAAMDIISADTRAAAERFGIDPDAVDAFQEPILVRVLEPGAAGRPGELSRALNSGMTAARTPDADAVSRAGRLDPAAVARLARVIGDDTLGQVFNDRARTWDLRRALGDAGVFTDSEFAEITDGRGMLTPAGRRMVESALLGSAIPDVRRLAETPPSVRNALTRALPALATLRAHYPGWVDTLGHALDALKEYRESGARSFEDLVSQTSIIPQPWRDDPRALTLARAIQRDNPTTLAARLAELAAVARDAASGQERMFADVGVSRAADEFDALIDGWKPSRPRGPDTTRSGMSTKGPDIPRGTSRGNFVDDPKLGRVAADDNRRMTAADGPASGVDPGLPRQGGPDAPAWLGKPPTSKAGKKIVGRIRSDPEGHKIGVRSIAEEFSRVLDVMVRQTREQTSRRSPAHYQARAHLIRTRSASEPAWMFHEQGHAVSAIVRDANPRFLKDFKAELVDLTRWSGSLASAQTPEEGFAEFVRRFISQPTRMEQWAPTARIVEALEKANPRITEAMRDTARAFDLYMKRPLPARWRSYMTDVRRRPFSPARVVNRLMTDFVSRGWAAEHAQNEALKAIRVEGGPKGLDLMRRVREDMTDTAADMRQAYQSLNHIPQMVSIALEGPGKGRTGGLRVHATIIPKELAQEWVARDEGAVWLGKAEREALAKAGFKVPKDPAKHGEIVVLAEKSVKEAIAEIPREKWADFEAYGQMKATLARIEARAREGQAFPYQTQGEGANPADLAREVSRFERENPKFLTAFKDLEEISSSVLLLQVLSGETTASDAIKAKAAFEHYLPLTRQGEGGPRAVGSGPTASPTAGIHRSHGSVNPAEPILMAIARKIDHAVNAYYWNRFALSPVVFAESLRKRPGVPFMAKAAADRVAIPLRMDTVKVATATPEEVQRAILEYIRREVAQGNPMFSLTPDMAALLTAEDIAITDGFDLWRRRPPKAVNVLAPTVNGRRVYFQVLDEDLYRIFADQEKVTKIAETSEALFGQATQSLKNQITQSFEFALRSLARDPLSAVMFGEDPAALVPGFYHVVGGLSILTGRAPETMADPELLSRVFRQVTPEDFARQRSKVMELLAEGVVPRGWRDMDLLRRTLSAPGIAYRILAKPIELFQVVTGQRAFANFMESAPRVGAYLMARKRGLSDEAAQLAADTVTGNFSERPLSATAHSLYRTSGFTNPMMQIFGQTARFFADPDPKRTAAVAATKMGAVATATAIVWAVNYLISTDEDRARNAERTEHERLTTMDVRGLRVPFDYGIMGGIQSFTWNMLDRIAGQRGVSGAAIAMKVIRETIPSMLTNPAELLPMSVRAALESQVNYSFYRGKPIEPPYMAYLEPGERYFDTTPDLYRWIGRATDTSPVRVQYLVRNGFGVQLDNANRLVDLVDQGFALDELSDLPGVGSLFTRDPEGWNSRSVQDAADLARRYDQLRARLDRIAEDGDPEAVEAVRRVVDKLQPVKDAMLEVQRLYDASKAAAEANPEAARELRREMIEAARRGLIEMESRDD